MTKNHVPHEKQSNCPAQDYTTSSKVQKLKEDNIITTVELATRRLVTPIVEFTAEDAFVVV